MKERKKCTPLVLDRFPFTNSNVTLTKIHSVHLQLVYCLLQTNDYFPFDYVHKNVSLFYISTSSSFFKSSFGKKKKKIQKFVFARDLKATPLEVDKQRRESIV